MNKYDWVTDEIFGRELERQVNDMSAWDLLSIPGVYEAVSEHLNNSVLEALDEQRQLSQEEEEEEEKNEHWFVNHYSCMDCEVDWTDEWSCQVDSPCPKCGTNTSPHLSEDA